MFRLKTVSILLAVGLFLGACGRGGGGEAAEGYASKICQAFSTWVQDIQKRNQTLTSALGPQATPEQGKEQLQVFMDSVIRDTDKLINSVESAGVPDVEGGDRAAEQIRNAAEKAKSSFENAREQVNQLSTNPTEFQQGAQSIGSEISSSLGSLGNELRNRSQSEEIQKAFQEAPTCARLRSGTTGGASPGS